MSNTGINVQRKILHGAFWMILVRLANRALGLTSTIILARLLMPEDYGLVAMAMSVYALMEIMAAFGFDVVLIQNSNATNDDYDTAWTLRFLVYSGLALVLYLLIPFAVDFYDEPRLRGVISCLAIGMLIAGFENIAIVDFRKKLQFSKEFYYELSIKLTGFLVTVPLAFLLRNHWALVIGILASKSARVIFGYIFIPRAPRFCFLQTKAIFNYSKWVLLSNFLGFAELKLPDFILGRLFGARIVGLFAMASELAKTTSAEIVAPINRAIFPGYSKMKDDRNELGKNYRDILAILAVTILPLGFGIAVTSEHIVGILLGDKWMGSALPLGILAIAFCLIGVTSNSQYIYLALGKPKISTLVAFLKVAFLIPITIYMANKSGMLGISLAYLGVYTFIPLLHFWLVSRLLNIPVVKLVATILRPVAACLIMYFVAELALPWLEPLSLHIFVEFLILTVLGGLTYCICLTVFWFGFGRPSDSGEMLVLRFVMEKLSSSRFVFKSRRL